MSSDPLAEVPNKVLDYGADAVIDPEVSCLHETLIQLTAAVTSMRQSRTAPPTTRFSGALGVWAEGALW